MAVTTSYVWFHGTEQLMNNLSTGGDQSEPAVAANFGRTEYFGVWSTPSLFFADQTQARVVRTNQTAVTDEFNVHPTDIGDQRHPAVAGVAGGNFVVVYNDFSADDGGDIRARLVSPDGVPGTDFAIDTGGADDVQPGVAALADGGFVVTYTREIGLDTGIQARVFNADGSVRQGVGLITVAIDQFANLEPTVAGLADGTFVVVYNRFDISISDTDVYFRRYTADGDALDPNPVLIDGVGSDFGIQVVALADGGFAVAYADDGWEIDFAEITLRIYNADGSARTSFIRANNALFGGIETGNQGQPTITTLGTGHIVVGWIDGTSATAISYAQVFDAAGNPVGNNFAFNASVREPEFAGLAGGFMASVHESFLDDSGSGTRSIRTSVSEFVRSFTGDDANDLISGVNDGLREILNGGGGDDILEGNAGLDTLDGGLGTDTASYASAPTGVTANLSDATANTGDAAGDTYLLIENLGGSAFADTLTGDGGANHLDGGAGDDALSGLDGDDLLAGGLGNDQLTGGLGNDSLAGGLGLDSLTGGLGQDSFLFNAAPDAASNLDTIIDFSHADDTILLDNAIFAKLKKDGALKKKYFEVGKKADDKNDYVVYNKKTGDLFYDADGSKKKIDPVAFAQLEDHLKVKADDFLVI